MIRDFDALGGGELSDYDLCIVGSGPAGGTLAAELAESGLRIAVLESGRERPTRFGDRLREVTSDGIPIKAYSRERVLGGASTTWAGLSSPLDEIDLGPREWLGSEGWPLEREELLRYWHAAAERWGFPALAMFDEDDTFEGLSRRGDLRPEWREVREKLFLAAAEPQDFGQLCRPAYEEGPVDLWLDASVTRLDWEGARVTAARVRSSGGVERELRARAFVIATGGIENARLLLLSTGADGTALGNARDQVGRYLMNHPKNSCGTLVLDEAVEELPYFFGALYKGYAGYAGLQLSFERQREEGLANSYVRFEPLFPWSDNDGVESLVLFAKKTSFVMRRFRKGKEDEVISLRDYSETGDDSDLQNERKTAAGWIGLAFRVLVNAPSVARYLYWRLIARRKPKIRRVRLRNFMEMEPSPENRVTLSDRRDAHGSPLPLVRHDTSERDRRSLLRLHDVLREECERLEIGSLDDALARTDPWPITQDASHHMGTTRMGDDPARSVVDRDLRVHGMENLYLAGASVFPTSGCANPTFTIVALSIRLAERLARELAPTRAESTGGRA